MEINKLSKMLVSDKQVLKQWILEETGAKTEHLFFERQGSFLWSNSRAENATMILLRTQSDGVVVTQKKENGYLAIPLGKTKPENVSDFVCISPNGHKGTVLKSDPLMVKSVSTFLPGERFLIQPSCECKGEMLYGRQASSVAMLQLAISLMKACCVTENPVTVAYVNESIAGTEETLRLIVTEKPERLVVCSAASEDAMFLQGNGPALVIKDGNGVVTAEFRKEMEDAAKECELALSYFIGKEDASFAKMYLAAKNNRYGGLYLAVKEKNSSLEEISFKDVEKTRTLLLKYLTNFAIITK